MQQKRGVLFFWLITCLHSESIDHIPGEGLNQGHVKPPLECESTLSSNVSKSLFGNYSWHHHVVDANYSSYYRTNSGSGSNFIYRLVGFTGYVQAGGSNIFLFTAKGITARYVFNTTRCKKRHEIIGKGKNAILVAQGQSNATRNGIV